MLSCEQCILLLFRFNFQLSFFVGLGFEFCVFIAGWMLTGWIDSFIMNNSVLLYFKNNHCKRVTKLLVNPLRGSPPRRAK